jgi:hypothetical protein
VNVRVSGRVALARTAAVWLTALAVLGIWAPAAQAAPTATIPLDPAQVELGLHPHENLGRTTLENPPPSGGTVTRMHHQWSASSRLVLPTEISGSAMVVSLELSLAEGAPPTRTYSSASSVPADLLVVNDLGGGVYEVVMPAYDPSNGPYGRLVFADLTSAAGPEFPYVGPLAYQLVFVGSGGIIQYHTPELIAVVDNVCATSSAARCSVAAGRTFRLTISPSSRLRTLSLGGLDSSSFSLQALDANGAPTGVPVVGAAFTVENPTGDLAKVTLGTGLRPGAYRLTVVDLGQVDGGLFPQYRAAVVGINLQVNNPGLRSNTGWGENEETAPARISPLVPIGAGMVLVAGIGAAVVLRRRTTPQD